MGWRRLAGLGIVAVAAAIAGGFFLLPLVLRGFIRSLELTINGAVWLAAALGSGGDAWSIASTVGRAAAAAIVTPRALAVIAALVLIGAGALYGLQRLLGYGEESSR
jgi:hypothetical protein